MSEITEKRLWVLCVMLAFLDGVLIGVLLWLLLWADALW